ncbi:helix-turn-helix domain-containing protein [Spirosoma sp. SC4-14]|uniref:helix-turn-helix domain-containing protein n=1 Tax=Spirosoma sp. SC4-14 TaxID=3128900 RepID=UPI0030D0656A
MRNRVSTIYDIDDGLIEISMAVAIPFATRQQIAQMRDQGKLYRQISQELGVSYDAVRRICKRQAQQGEEGLVPHYKQCGTKGIRLAAFYHRVSLWLKRAHPLWGAPYIRLQLDARYAMGRLPSIRTLQLWFKAANLTKPRPQLLNTPKVWAEYPHQVWQVDAKEHQRTLDGTKVCWLTVVDEKSGAVLAAPVFPLWPNRSSTLRDHL